MNHFEPDVTEGGGAEEAADGSEVLWTFDARLKVNYRLKGFYFNNSGRKNCSQPRGDVGTFLVFCL